MNEVGSSLDAMDVEQYLFGFLFLMSYSAALSRLVGPRSRGCAAALALAAAAGFAGLSDPWERGVLVMACAIVAIGGFSAVAWALWALVELRYAEPSPSMPEPEFEPLASPAPRLPAVAPHQAGVAST